MTDDPRAILDRGPMSRFQWRIVSIMVGLNALDGFDVLSISFASPGIAAAWHIDRAVLGVVLSMELVGMTIGSLLLGSAGDRWGRRATILVCLGVMAAGMVGAATAGGVAVLSGWRVLTGVGIGGMLAVTNAATAEATDARRRNLGVVLMAGGYPMGTIVGGVVSAWLLTRFAWPAVFLFGAAVTACFVPLVLRSVPESIAFLVHRRPPGALAQINGTLRRMGHSAVAALPPPDPASPRTGPRALFTGGLAPVTLLLTIAYLAQITTFYFILKWIPKIVVDMGLAPPLAAGVLVWASIGGWLGAMTLAALTTRVRVLPLTLAAALLSVVLVVHFGQQHRDLAGLSSAAAVTGFATNAGMVGLYALLAQAFPAPVRATASGFVVGIGRGGAALAPALAGWLFAAGYGLPAVSAIMATGSAVAALALVAVAVRGQARA